MTIFNKEDYSLVTLEQVSKLRDYTDITIEEAKDILEKTNGDVLEAVLELEKKVKNYKVALQEGIDTIKSEAENMKELVEQLLFLARGDNETQHLDIQPINEIELVEEVIKEASMIDSTHLFKMKKLEPLLIQGD